MSMTRELRNKISIASIFIFWKRIETEEDETKD